MGMEVPITRPTKVRSNRRPYDGDGVYGSTRQRRHPGVSPRLAMWRTQPRGRWAYWGRFFHEKDRIEMDQIDSDRRHARVPNLQALHGHCHDAKTREQGD